MKAARVTDGVMQRFGSQQARLGSHAHFSVWVHDVVHTGEVSIPFSLVSQLILSDNYPKQSSSGTWWNTGSWIGLTDNKTSGTWVWVNNVTAETLWALLISTASCLRGVAQIWSECDFFPASYWRVGQPKTEGPQSGSCAAFHFYGDTRKTWYNGNCQEHQFNWICETKPK